MSKDNSYDEGRRVALKCLQQVIASGESLSTVLPRESARLEAREKAMVQALVYGVLRWRWRIEAILKPLLKKPLKKKDLDVQLLLMLGVFQLYWMRTPDYAAVDAAVKSAKRIKKPWARGLVNAVLRELTRQRDNAEIDSKQLEAYYSHPDWIIQCVQADWPEQWQSLLEHANQLPPMTLRVDLNQIDRQAYLFALADNGINGAPHPLVASAVVLDTACDVQSLPGFNNGLVSVQDASAQLAATLLQLEPGHRVLDACAASGGKSVHMLQLEPSIELDAIDISEQRLERVQQNLDRLSLNARLIAADVNDTNAWFSGSAYDRILLDAPCSATGVIRRHPDIKSLRREQDITALAELQQQILQTAWSLLKPGGLLLYATCSIFKKENEQRVLSFIERTEDAAELVIDADWGQARPAGRQILSGENNMDGFYYALLQKSAK